MIYISSGCRNYGVGKQNYLNSYFSTISKRLEPKGWGTRFPHIFKDLYPGELLGYEVEEVLKEFYIVREELKKVPKWRRIWDYFKEEKYIKEDDVGDKKAKNCYDYFVAEESRKNITEIFIERLEDALENNEGVYIGILFDNSDMETAKIRADKNYKKIKDNNINLSEEEYEKLRLPYKKISFDEGIDYVSVFYAELNARLYDANNKEEIEEEIKKIIEERDRGEFPHL